MMLTDTHQMALVARKLRNCVGGTQYFSAVRQQDFLLVAMSTSTSLDDVMGLGKWAGTWTEICGVSNKTSPKQVQDSFDLLSSVVRPIWEAPLRELLQEAVEQDDRRALESALSRAQQGRLPEEVIESARRALAEQPDHRSKLREHLATAASLTIGLAHEIAARGASPDRRHRPRYHRGVE
eukprot:UN4457